MAARLSAFVIWGLVGMVTVFWLSRLTAQALPTPSHAGTVSTATAARGDLSRLLGAPPVAAAPVIAIPDAAGRFKLVGVMAPRGAALPAAGGTPESGAASAGTAPGQQIGQGVALISVDGKPARPYRVGASIENEFVLQAVAARGVSIGSAQAPQAPPIRLELPALPAPATGQLPPPLSMTSSGATGANPAPPAAMVAPPTAVMPPANGAPIVGDPNAQVPQINLPPGMPPNQAR
jgi:general secretion pathway protein C